MCVTDVSSQHDHTQGRKDGRKGGLCMHACAECGLISSRSPDLDALVAAARPVGRPCGAGAFCMPSPARRAWPLRRPCRRVTPPRASRGPPRSRSGAITCAAAAAAAAYLLGTTPARRAFLPGKETLAGRLLFFLLGAACMQCR